MEKNNEIRDQVSEYSKQNKKTGGGLERMLQLIVLALTHAHNAQHFINWVWWYKRNSGLSSS